MEQQQEHAELGGLGRLIQRHWKEFRPKMYAEMEKQGVLHQLLVTEEQQALETISLLMRQGMKYQEAWEIVQPDLLLPSEEDAPELGMSPDQLSQVESQDTTSS